MSQKIRQSLEVWFPGDVEDKLLAVYMSHKHTADRLPDTPENAAYQEGYADALKATAASFGLYNIDALKGE